MDEPLFDAAIVGSGVVGLSCALHLQRRGLSVVVIDPDRPETRASYGNAGVISRGSLFPVAGPGIWRNLWRYALGRDVAVRFRWPALPSLVPWGTAFLRASNERSWRATAAALNPLTAAAFDDHLDLAELAGTRDLIKRNGWLRLYRSEAAWEGSALERLVLAESGVATEILDARELAELEPFLAPRFVQGILFPETGSVESPGELTRLYGEAFRSRGGAVVTGEAASLAQESDGVAIRLADRTVRARFGVIAAGARSGALARGLGYRIPYAAERGYHVHLKLKGNAVLGRPINDTGGGYVISPMGDTVRLLTGVELARPDDPPRSDQMEAVLTDAAQTLPLGGPPSGPTWHGSRPSTPDGLPVIGFAPRHDRIVLAFGHGHIGLSTGPVTGRIVADLIQRRQTDLPIAPFSAARFGGGR